MLGYVFEAWDRVHN
jgi:serine/threonine protein kinase